MHANFADLTPDGFYFWVTLSPRTSEPVRHVPVPPLEQNSGDATTTQPRRERVVRQLQPFAAAKMFGQTHTDRQVRIELLRITAV